MALVAVLMSASCAKEDPAKPIDYSAPEKQATIKGKLLINDNTTLTTPKYSAISGVTIIASISYSSLSGDDAQGSFSTTATTDSKGDFTLTVPATSSGVTVNLVANDIQGSLTTTSTSGSGSGTEIQQGKWSFDLSSPSVLSGQTVILSSVVGTFTQIKSAGDEVGNDYY
ncbi:MAG: hypothetical protein LBF67_06850 [Prevotellaceae bacterium]|jgi:hypothetical protein|nr:hypothetical protein [Prevotellaceae bacterium]